VNDEIVKRLDQVFNAAQRQVGAAVRLERRVLDWPPAPPSA